MGRRFLSLTVCLAMMLTCTLAEQGPSPLKKAEEPKQAFLLQTPQPQAASSVQPEVTIAPSTSAKEDGTPEFVELLLSVAREELGYTEKKSGYTKYGDWSGDPYAQWCAEFLCWSVDQTDKRYGTDLLKKQYPLYSGTNVGRDWFIAQGRYIDRRGAIDNWGDEWFPGQTAPMERNDYIPQPGDWMFFTWRGGRDTDHVAMVEYTDTNEKGETVIHTIEGNNPSKVERGEYLLTDPKILGYGTVKDLADVTMRAGNKGEKVLQLQNKLVELELIKPQDADGVFGGKTLAAIKTFQKGNMTDKNASGIADMETQLAIGDEIERRRDSDPANWVVAGD